MSQKLTIKEMQEIAQSRGGYCLSNVYVDQNTELKWKCAEGHTWDATPDAVKGSKNRKGTWCRICGIAKAAQNRRQTVDDLRALADEMDGEFLSNESKGSDQLHCWSCKNPEHPSFLMRPGAVSNGQWCPYCAGNAKPTLSELNQLAQTMRGNSNARCTSPAYKNSTTLLKWSCGVDGHAEFEKSYRSVKHDGGWCGSCPKSRKTKYNLTTLKKIAKTFGGELLSENYKNTKTKLDWRCADGHEFPRSVDTMRTSRSFCPQCSGPGRVKERWVATLFSHLLGGVQFPKVKPSWLVSVDNTRLELDGYSEELRIAFEYQGEQHYHVGFYSPDPEALTKRQRDDDRKRELCRARKITLIEIKYTLAWADIQRYVTGELESHGHRIVDPSELPIGVVAHSEIEKLQELAKRRDGKLISTRYMGSGQKLTWQCSNPAHKPFDALPSTIKRGSWCDLCADIAASDRYRQSIEEIEKWAKKANGKLLKSKLSEQNLELGLKLSDSAEFQCHLCNQTSARTILNVRDGSLCLCKTNKVRITRERVNAALTGLEIVVVKPDEINKGNVTVTLECEKCGKSWEKKASSIITSQKAHRCGLKFTIEKARAYGQQAGFDLVSEAVGKATDNVDWKCSKAKHKITETPRTMRNKRNCEECENDEAFIKLGAINNK